MRIRSTKPEFWKSERIARMSWDARLVLKGLESYVDDNGVGRDDIALIVTDVFPRDMFESPRETVERVSEAVSELHKHGFVHRYKAGDTSCLYLSWWDSTQRIDKPGKGRFPRPDGTMEYKESDIRESVASPPVTLAPGTGEQGNRGTDSSASASADGGSQNANPSSSTSKASKPAADKGDFDAWWAAYPRKKDKGHARKAYNAALRKTDAETLLQAAKDQAPTLTAKGMDFAPYPATWLNGERWEDEAGDNDTDDHWANIPDISALREARGF